MDVKNDELLDKNVPFIVYEAAEKRADCRHKRMVIALIIALILIFASNVAWLVAWCQYDYTSTSTIEATQDGKGVNLLSGGDMIYGAAGKSYQNKVAD